MNFIQSFKAYLDANYDDKSFKETIFKDVAKIFDDCAKGVSSSGKAKIVIDGIELDKTSYTLTIDKKRVDIAKKEFLLLELLMSRRNIMYDRQTLLNLIWGFDSHVNDRTVDVHIRKLRKKLGKYRSRLISLKGVGYKFD